MFRKTKRIPPPREVLLTDRVVQGVLIKRMILYAMACLLYFCVIEFLDVALSDPSLTRWEIANIFYGEAVYWAPGLIVMLPIFAYDLLRISNRFTGPVVRLRKEMRQLTRGDEGTPIEFRSDDYWLEMAEEYNFLRDEVIKLRAQLLAVKSAPSQGETPLRKGSLFAKKEEPAEA